MMVLEHSKQLDITSSQSPDFPECSPAEQFRLFMRKKFRELDVEFQRVMALEPISKQHMLTTRVTDAGALAVNRDAQSPGRVSINKPFPRKVKANPGDGPISVFALSEAADVSGSFYSRDGSEYKQSYMINATSPHSPRPRISFNQTHVTSLISSGSGKFANNMSLCASICNAELAPENAFVINVRRLIDIQEKLYLLHDLLKSTAIAAITLPAAGTAEQFCATLLFLPVVFILYAMHERDWDRLEVTDIKILLPLLCDDIDPKHNAANPNRLFKAVTIETSRVLSKLFHLFQLVVAIGIAVVWATIEYRWRNPPPAGNNIQLGNSGGFRQEFADGWMLIEEDVLAMGMQVTVATLMLLLQVLFEYIHWRETSAVMPRTRNAEAWDPRRHGTPTKYWLFGLPSMWFTSEDALQKLKKYIGMASADSERVTKIYPQELAYFALSGDSERAELQISLDQCKLFNGRTQSYVFDGEHPEQLELGLCFFDDKLRHKAFPYRGEFMYYLDDNAAGQEGELSRHSNMSRSSRKANF